MNLVLTRRGPNILKIELTSFMDGPQMMENKRRIPRGRIKAKEGARSAVVHARMRDFLEIWVSS